MYQKSLKIINQPTDQPIGNPCEMTQTKLFCEGSLNFSMNESPVITEKICQNPTITGNTNSLYHNYSS